MAVKIVDKSKSSPRSEAKRSLLSHALGIVASAAEAALTGRSVPPPTDGGTPSPAPEKGCNVCAQEAAALAAKRPQNA